jgi:hypothetical protein
MNSVIWTVKRRRYVTVLTVTHIDWVITNLQPGVMVVRGEIPQQLRSKSSSYTVAYVHADNYKPIEYSVKNPW